MLKQIIKDKDIVKLANKDELKFNLIKSSFSKILKESIENEKIFRKIVMDLMPDFHQKVREREILLGKDRSEFSVFEKQQLLDEFEKEHIDVLQGARFDI